MGQPPSTRAEWAQVAISGAALISAIAACIFAILAFNDQKRLNRSQIGTNQSQVETNRVQMEINQSQKEMNQSQLKLNKSLDDRSRERFASRVAWWWVRDDGSVPTIRVQNRSPSPLRDVRLVVRSKSLAEAAEQAAREVTGEQSSPHPVNNFYLDELAPCTLNDFVLRLSPITKDMEEGLGALRAELEKAVLKAKDWSLEFSDTVDRWSFSTSGLNPTAERMDYELGRLVPQRGKEDFVQDCGEGY